MLLEVVGDLGAGVQGDPALDGAGDEAEVVDLHQTGVVNEHVEVPPTGTGRGGLLIGPDSTQPSGLAGLDMN